jgi:hypothetical protein
LRRRRRWLPRQRLLLTLLRLLRLLRRQRLLLTLLRLLLRRRMLHPLHLCQLLFMHAVQLLLLRRQPLSLLHGSWGWQPQGSWVQVRLPRLLWLH